MKNIKIQIASILILYYASVVALYLSNVLNGSVFSACLISGVLAGVNVISSVWAFSRAQNRSNSQFLLYNFGVMSLRMLILLIIIFILIQYFNVDKYGFVFSFFFCYIVFLVVEILFFTNKSVRKRI